VEVRGTSRPQLDVSIRDHIVLLENLRKHHDVHGFTSIPQRRMLQQVAVDAGPSVIAGEKHRQGLRSTLGHPQTYRVKPRVRQPIYFTVQDHLKGHSSRLLGCLLAIELPQSRREGAHLALGAEQLH